jgi:hypothetical protein
VKRYKVGDIGVGGWEESWYYAEYDPDTGKAFWVKEWDNLTHKFQSNEGENRLPLEMAVGKQFYKEAVEAIRSNHPEWDSSKAQ